MFKDVLNITKRELSAYFNSPIAYVFIVVFLLITCGLYMTTFFLSGICSMRQFFTNLPLVLVIFVPAVTMRLWADERKSGTMALLFSLPTGSTSLVLGKFVAALIFGALALAGTVTIPFMLTALGAPDPGPIVTGYLGALLLTGFLLSMGMMVSAFFADQMVAFILSLMLGFICFLSGTGFISAFIDGWIPGFGTFLNETIGIPSHFSSFEKGVLDLGDILFFLLFTMAFLAINVLTLEGYLRRKTSKGFVLGAILLTGSVVFFNGVIAGTRTVRIDLTENHLYTLSPATKRVLERLKVPITVTYYVSSKDKLPTPMKDIARDVGDKLEELSRLSSKFTYKIVNPASIPGKLDELRKKGIVPFNAQTIARDTLDIKRIYSAITIAYLDKKEEILPQIVPDSLGNLEYDLVSKIYWLTLDHPPKILLVAPERHLPAETIRMLQQMGRAIPPQDEFMRASDILESQGYTVIRKKIGKNSPIPKDTSLILVMAPENLNQRQQYEIEKFIRSGKPAIFAVQKIRYNYEDGPDGPMVMAQKTDTNIDSLLSKYGVTVDGAMLFDKRHLTLSIARRQQMGIFTAMVRTPVNYPMQIQVLPDQMNQDVSITNMISGILYLWGTQLVIHKDTVKHAGLDLTTLFTSSPESWTRPYHFGPLTRKDLATPDPKKLRSRPLAVLLEGTLPMGFKRPPAWPEDKSANATKKDGEKDPAQPVTAAPSRVIVIGCAEAFSDTAIPALSNATLLLNSVDALALGNELIGIRSKIQKERFIAPVSVQGKILWRSIVMGLVPALWILFGASRAVRRRKNRERCNLG